MLRRSARSAAGELISVITSAAIGPRVRATLPCPPAPYDLVEGDLDVLLIAWAESVTAAAGLAALARVDDSGLAAREQLRIVQAAPTPPGWGYVWYLGPSECFRSADDGAVYCIDCATRAAAAISLANPGATVHLA